MTDLNALTLELRYSCHGCGLVDIRVAVPIRTAEQNVLQWMDQSVLPVLGHDHLLRSPQCRTTSLADVKIPFAHGAERVGDLPSQ